MADGLAVSAAAGDSSYRDWIGGIHDPGVGAALVAHADRVLDSDPRRALELYSGALECGLDPAVVVGRRARAAWASGNAELASSILDGVASLAEVADHDRVADTSAAIWSHARDDAHERHGLLLADAGQCRSRALERRSPSFGVGRAPAVAPDETPGLPSTLGVAMDLLDRGLRASMDTNGAETARRRSRACVGDVHASAATTSPIPELPAVIAAIVAMNVGDLDVAHTVIDDAIRGGQGGEWARTRLLLWRSWLAVQSARPAEAREALTRALDSSPSRSARDNVLAQAIRVGDRAALRGCRGARRDLGRGARQRPSHRGRPVHPPAAGRAADLRGARR